MSKVEFGNVEKVDCRISGSRKSRLSNSRKSKKSTVELLLCRNTPSMKPPGVSPNIKAFIYNTYCLPKCTCRTGIFNLTKKTIKSINVSQNNLFRYALNIPYKSHIPDITQMENNQLII